MKKFLKKACAMILGLTLTAGFSVTAVADTFEPGQDTTISVQLYMMTGDTPVNKWKWIDTANDENKFFYGEAGHYTIDVEPGLFEIADNPMNAIGFQVGYFNSNAAGGNMIMSFANVVFYFDGFDPIAINDFVINHVPEDNTLITQQNFIEEFNVLGIDVAERVRKMTRVEFDAAVLKLEAFTADGELIVVGGEEATAEPTEEETTAEETTLAEETTTVAVETTLAETTVKETTVKETTVKETTAKETTLAEETTAKETTIAEEEKSSDAEESAKTETTAAEKSESGNSSVKVIVTLVFVVLLLGALGFVGFMYMKRR